MTRDEPSKQPFLPVSHQRAVAHLEFAKSVSPIKRDKAHAFRLLSGTTESTAWKTFTGNDKKKRRDARAKDEERLARGEVSPNELQRQNFVFKNVRADRVGFVKSREPKSVKFLSL